MGFTEEWEKKELGTEVADITGGGTPSTSNPEYWNGNVDWYSPTEIGGEVYANGSVKQITELGLKNSSAKLLPAGKTILFTSRAGIGDLAILQRPGTTSQGFQSLILKEGYDTHFFYSMGHLIKQYAEKYSSGSTFLEISGKTLGYMTMNVPSVIEQAKIGSFFQSLDALIALHQRKHNKLIKVKNAMLEKMFPKKGTDVPEIRFKGFTGKWRRKTLGEDMEISSAARVHKEEWTNDGVPFFRSSDVVANFKGEVNKKAYISYELYNELSTISGCVQANDILVTGGGSIGIPYLVKNNKPLYFKDADLLWLKKCATIDCKYLYIYLTTMLFSTYVKNITHIGTISHYTIEQAKSTPIMLPKKDEQVKIAAFFQHLDTIISLHQRELDKLKNLKKACLEKMFV